MGSQRMTLCTGLLAGPPGTAHAVTGLVLAGAAATAVVLLPRALGKEARTRRDGSERRPRDRDRPRTGAGADTQAGDQAGKQTDTQTDTESESETEV